VYQPGEEQRTAAEVLRLQSRIEYLKGSGASDEVRAKRQQLDAEKAKLDKFQLPWLQGAILQIRDGTFLIRKDTLGEGATSRVHLYTWGEREVVVKTLQSYEQLQDRFASSYEAFKRECAVLRRFFSSDSRSCDGFPQPSAVIPCLVQELELDNLEADNLEADNFHIFMTPVGKALSFQGKSVEDRKELATGIVAALMYSAQNSTVHRDVRPNNMLMHEKDGRFYGLLIDWGFAVPAGEMYGYEGTGRFASQRILKLSRQGETTFAVSCSDDACSLVKAIHYLNSVPPREVPKQRAFDKTLRYWEVRFETHTRLSAAYAIAEAIETSGSPEQIRGAYVKLKDAIHGMIF
jgi:serine/threonine protein kinase